MMPKENKAEIMVSTSILKGIKAILRLPNLRNIISTHEHLIVKGKHKE
jgi:hypothetical protein